MISIVPTWRMYLRGLKCTYFLIQRNIITFYSANRNMKMGNKQQRWYDLREVDTIDLYTCDLFISECISSHSHEFLPVLIGMDKR